MKSALSAALNYWATSTAISGAVNFTACTGSHQTMPNKDKANDTSFKPGNKAWEARTKHGRNHKYTPKQLETACYEYFNWVHNNPLMAAETVKHQGAGDVMAVPVMRAMNIRALCDYLKISQNTWKSYKTNADFLNICEEVENIIWSQKFEGAAAGLLNHAIIARELGLADKQDHTVKGELKTIDKEMSLEEATRIYQDNLKSLGDE